MVSPQHLEQGFARAPIVRFLGLELVNAENGRARVLLPFREDLQQGLGMLHGGILALTADTACWFAASSDRDDALPLSVELKINFLKPAVKTDVIAEAEVVKTGRKVTVVRFEVTNALGDLLAIGLSTLVVDSALKADGIPPPALANEAE